MIWFISCASVVALVILTTPGFLVWRDEQMKNLGRIANAERDQRRKEFWETRPSRLSELPEKYRIAANSVAAELVAENEKPEEFRAVVGEKDEETWIFYLWHVSAIEIKRDARAKGLSVIGNPGGRCRNIEFDLKAQKASASQYWQ